MANKRTYEDGCATAHALDLIGERWAILIVRELILGPKRFTDLRASLPGISANVLTMRLDELETSAILERRKLPPPSASWVYELTEWGHELENVIMAMGRWGARSPSLLDAQYPLSADALALSFRTMFSRDAAQDLDTRLNLRIGGDTFGVSIDQGEMYLRRGAMEWPEAIIEGSTETFVAVAYAGRRFADALKSGDLKVDGDKNIAKRFFSLFPLPRPANAIG